MQVWGIETWGQGSLSEKGELRMGEEGGEG
jgi:hypothetical protein